MLNYKLHKFLYHFFPFQLWLYLIITIFLRCEIAKNNPEVKGTIKSFCRAKGHGFITPEDDPDEELFVHISE